jgi:hypothetical protein
MCISHVASVTFAECISPVSSGVYSFCAWLRAVTIAFIFSSACESRAQLAHAVHFLLRERTAFLALVDVQESHDDLSLRLNLGAFR